MSACKTTFKQRKGDAMLRTTFNQFKNRRLLNKFAIRDGHHKGFSLTLVVKTLQENDPQSLPGFRTRLEELPWAGSLLATNATLFGAHSIAKSIEADAYYSTGKAYDVFLKPEGTQNFYGGDDVLLGLPTGKHQILLLPKGAIPHDGYCTMNPGEPLRQAGEAPAGGKSLHGKMSL